MVEPVNLEDFREKPSPKTLETGRGGGDFTGMDAWQESVEGRLGSLGTKIDGQLKWLLIAFASGFILLGGLILNRTDALAEKIGAVSAQVAQVKTDTAVLAARKP